MFRDFETTKLHLNELSEIINKFKSEAVQLRLIELLFNGSAETDSGAVKQDTITKGRRPKRKRKTQAQSSLKDQMSATPKKRGASGSGAVATLTKAFDDKYFNQPRTIGDFCKHSETNLARRIKPNEISGKLTRMVREKQLSRVKNADGQYEYQNA